MVKGFPNKSLTNTNKKPHYLPHFEEQSSKIMELNLEKSFLDEYYRSFVVNNY